MGDQRFHNKANLAMLRLLLKLELLSPNQSVKELEASEFGPVEFFANTGLFTEADALRAIGHHLQIPFFEITKDEAKHCLACLEHKTFNQISLSRWKEMRAVPMQVNFGAVSIAMANPLDHESKSALEFQLGIPVSVGIASEGAILAVLGEKLNAKPLFDVEKVVPETDSPTQDRADLAQVSKQETNIFNGDAEAAPIVKLVNKIFSDAIESEASDIHLTPDSSGLSVRVRVDGIMRGLLEVPAQMMNAVASRIKLLGGMDISERRKPQDGRLRIRGEKADRDLRISSVPAIHGENVVIRILSGNVEKVSFETLGMPKEVRDRLARGLKGSSRVILVSGPTGSGKTSTLYSCLMSMSDGTSNIVTVEDPIEYRIGGITQIQVNHKTGMSFAEGLKATLRQDPDVIMVGEIRDKETAQIAMQSAQTGHLVLSSIHTNSAPATITRLQDLGIAPYLTASSLGMVVAQRLVRKLCACAKPFEGEIHEAYRNLYLDAASMRVPMGCETCRGTGYKGRLGIYSILEVNDFVREAIREDLGEIEIARRAHEVGFESLEEAGIKLVVRGETSLDELEQTLGSLEGWAPSHPQAQSESLNKKEGAGLQKRKILLVEDDENTRSILSMLLQSEFFEVIEAGDGFEGLERVYQEVPELILCDLMMPRMDGAQMLEKLRKDPRTREIPVIMLTAADTEDNELKSIACGADDFVSKTADSKVMLARVQRLLERAQP